MKNLREDYQLLVDNVNKKMKIWVKDTPNEGTIYGSEYFIPGLTKKAWKYYQDN